MVRMSSIVPSSSSDAEDRLRFRSYARHSVQIRSIGWRPSEDPTGCVSLLVSHTLVTYRESSQVVSHPVHDDTRWHLPHLGLHDRRTRLLLALGDPRRSLHHPLSTATRNMLLEDDPDRVYVV